MKVKIYSISVLVGMYNALFFSSCAFASSDDKNTSLELSRSDEVRMLLDRLEEQRAQGAAAKPEVSGEKEDKAKIPPASIPDESTIQEAPQVETAESTQVEKKDFWERLALHGYLENRYYYDTEKENNTEHYFEMRNDARIERLFNFGENVKMKLSVDGQYDAVRSRVDSYDVEVDRFQLWEGYFTLKRGSFDFKAGQQVIRWGKSDELNPTDVFTPENFSEFLNRIMRAERKIPVPALKVDYYHSDSQVLEGIWVPIFIENKWGTRDSDWSPYVRRTYEGLGFMREEKTPAKQLKNSSVALKWMRIGETADFSLSYSYHFNQNPSSHLLVNEGKYVTKHFRQHTIGSDFETVIGKLGLRGEAAYTTKNSYINIDPLDEDRTSLRDSFTSIAGVDYTFGENLYCNLQYMQEYIFDYPDYTIEQEYSDSYIWKVSKTFLRDKLKLETIGRSFLSRRDYFYKLSASYDINDNLRFTLGADVFDGDEDTSFGQFDRNDQVFAHLKYFF